MSAEIGLGAAGCASGSQTWRGIIPALTPKPARKSRKTASREGVAAAPGPRREANASDCPCEARRKKPATRQPVPTWESAR